MAKLTLAQWLAACGGNVVLVTLINPVTGDVVTFTVADLPTAVQNALLAKLNAVISGL